MAQRKRLPYNGPRNRVAIYRRVRTKQQKQGHSLDTQLEDCRRYAARQGWVIVDEIEDDLSGLISTRPGYQKLIKLADGGHIDFVLIWRLDRIGREDGDSIPFCNSLDRLGIEIHSATQGLLDPLTRNILLVVAKNESRSISARVTPNMQRAVRDGKCVTRPQYGYRFHPDKDHHRGLLVPFVAEADVVKKMFGKALAGWSMYAITSWLNDLSYPDGTRVLPPAARDGVEGANLTWTTRTVKHILTNKIYIGIVEYDRTSRSTLRPPAESQQLLTAKGKHEALISLEDFEEVQLLLRDQTRKYHYKGVPGTGEFLFAGLVRCGICGRRCHGCWNNETRLRRQGKDPHQNPVYKCTTRSHATRSERKLEKLVLAYLSILLHWSPETLKALRQQVLEEASRRDTTEEQERVKVLHQKRAKLITRIANSDIDLADRQISRDRHQNIVQDAERQIQEIDQELVALEAAVLEDPTAFIDQAEDWLRSLRAAVMMVPRYQGVPYILDDTLVLKALQAQDIGFKHGVLSRIIDHIQIASGSDSEIVWRPWVMTLLSRRRPDG
jgi:DNA invertase Pin-like site-specific DNA recombinase